jgi:hypothetical protein
VNEGYFAKVLTSANLVHLTNVIDPYCHRTSHNHVKLLANSAFLVHNLALQPTQQYVKTTKRQ